MKKRIYWKDIWQSFSQSKGRFLSIFSLMAIGALALVGLKVTSPNMEQTAQSFVSHYQVMDLSVLASYGLDEEDIKELDSLEGATVEFGYLSDVTIKGTDDAVRIFSLPETISQYKLVSGTLPSKATEIALESSMEADYQIGDTISFSQSDSGVLKETSFTVTGFVDSSEIWDKDTMGTSTAGYGELTGYGVTTADAFDSDAYLIARIRYQDLENLTYDSTAYTQKLAQHKKELDELLADNGSQRLARLKSDGQATIDKGYEDIAASEKRLADAAQALSQGQEQISSGQAQLTAAQTEIASNEDSLNQAASQLASGQAQLASSKETLDAAKAQLEAGQAQLATTKAQLDQAANQLAAAKATLAASQDQLAAAASQLASAKQILDSKKAELDAAQAQLSAAQATLTQAQADLQAQKDALRTAGQDPDSDSSIQALQAQLDAQAQILAAQEAALQAGLAQYQSGLDEYNRNQAAYKAGLAQYQAGLATYNENQAAYEAGLAQYQSGLASYNENQAAYEAGLAQYQSGFAQLQASQAQYDSGLAQLNQAKATIASNQAEIDQAISQLASSTQEYNSQKVQAEEKIASAKADLEAAQEKLDQLEESTYTSYTRSTIPGGTGYTTYTAATGSISSVGNIFPVVLYLVAALVTFTTMTRFVDEERNNAGIFKALGYTNRDIIAKFVIYGLVASLLGTVVGILAGNFILSPIIGNIISGTSVIGSAHLYFYPSWTLLAIVLALISAVLPAYLVARKELTEKPAQLLLAKPPVSGSTILLERITFLWKRLSFTHKVTARNIFRYKQRMFMTIFGVAGSVALLFAGLGIQSSISGVSQAQFEDILQYDLIVAENSGASQAEKDEVTDLLDTDAVSSQLAIQYSSQEEEIVSTDDAQTVSFIITDSQKLTDFVRLRNRSSDENLTLTNSGAILSEKLAKLYGVSVGDTVQMVLDGKEVTLKVAGISEIYAGHFVYMTADYYQSVTGDSSTNNAWLVRLKDDSTSNIQSVSASFLEMAGVSAVVQNTSLIKQVDTVSNSLNSVMLILVVLSVLLAVVILYNLTNINVAERIRELSTIKVLGFHNKEVTLYIYRETIVLSIVGIVTGLVGGVLLHLTILNMIGSANIMFNPEVALYVYLVPILAIIIILAVLGWLVNHTLRKVDMLEALKSVE